MKKSLFTLVLFTSFLGAQAQKFLTREAYVSFFSATAMENIEAKTNEASSVLNAANGEFVCQVLMKSFHFEKALMEEHFNENYVESDQYPKAVFKGKLEEWNGALDLTQDKVYPLKAKGTMTMHGVEKEINVDVTLTVKAGKVSIESKFNLVPEDFNIVIPNAVRDNIAKQMEVVFKATYNAVN